MTKHISLAATMLTLGMRSRQTLYTAVKNGKLTKHKIGRETVFLQADVIALAKERFPSAGVMDASFPPTSNLLDAERFPSWKLIERRQTDIVRWLGSIEKETNLILNMLLPSNGTRPLPEYVGVAGQRELYAKATLALKELTSNRWDTGQTRQWLAILAQMNEASIEGLVSATGKQRAWDVFSDLVIGVAVWLKSQPTLAKDAELRSLWQCSLDVLDQWRDSIALYLYAHRAPDEFLQQELARLIIKGGAPTDLAFKAALKGLRKRKPERKKLHHEDQ